MIRQMLKNDVFGQILPQECKWLKQHLGLLGLYSQK